MFLPSLILIQFSPFLCTIPTGFSARIHINLIDIIAQAQRQPNPTVCLRVSAHINARAQVTSDRTINRHRHCIVRICKATKSIELPNLTVNLVSITGLAYLFGYLVLAILAIEALRTPTLNVIITICYASTAILTLHCLTRRRELTTFTREAWQAFTVR